jgi:hypothetical protein
MSAPSVNTGMTSTRALNASTNSRRIQSAGSSIRRPPPGPSTVSQVHGGRVPANQRARLRGPPRCTPGRQQHHGSGCKRRNGPAAAVRSAPRPSRHRTGRALAHDHGRSTPAQCAQPMAPRARSASAWHSSNTMITAVGSSHDRQALPTTPTAAQRPTGVGHLTRRPSTSDTHPPAIGIDHHEHPPPPRPPERRPMSVGPVRRWLRLGSRQCARVTAGSASRGRRLGRGWRPNWQGREARRRWGFLRRR